MKNAHDPFGYGWTLRGDVIQSESPEGSTERAQNTYTIYWLFVELNVLQWSTQP